MEDEQTYGETATQKTGWIIEMCRFCKKRMYATHQRPKVNGQTGQMYLETENNCPQCDYWLTTRIPYALARTISDTIYLPTREEIQQKEKKSVASS